METLPPIKFYQSFKLVFQNCCKFSGRSRRSEFFYYYTTINIIILILHFLATILFHASIFDDGSLNDKTDKIIEALVISIIATSFVTFIPLLSLIVRRFHDTGKTGWLVSLYIFTHLGAFFPNFLALFARLIGEWAIISLLYVDSQQMTNKYGPSPKYILNRANNYIPPNRPINQFPQPNYRTIPVNSNYPFHQLNNIQPQIISYPQPIPFPNQANFYPQQNSIQNEGSPYSPQNPIPSKGIPYPQQNTNQYKELINKEQNLLSTETMDDPRLYNFPPQNNPCSQTNPIKQPNEGVTYPPSDDPYSKPNPMQP